MIYLPRFLPPPLGNFPDRTHNSRFTLTIPHTYYLISYIYCRYPFPFWALTIPLSTTTTQEHMPIYRRIPNPKIHLRIRSIESSPAESAPPKRNYPTTQKTHVIKETNYNKKDTRDYPARPNAPYRPWLYRPYHDRAQCTIRCSNLCIFPFLLYSY